MSETIRSAEETARGVFATLPWESQEKLLVTLAGDFAKALIEEKQKASEPPAEPPPMTIATVINNLTRAYALGNPMWAKDLERDLEALIVADRRYASEANERPATTDAKLVANVMKAHEAIVDRLEQDLNAVIDARPGWDIKVRESQARCDANACREFAEGYEGRWADKQQVGQYFHDVILNLAGLSSTKPEPTPNPPGPSPVPTPMTIAKVIDYLKTDSEANLTPDWEDAEKDLEALMVEARLDANVGLDLVVRENQAETDARIAGNAGYIGEDTPKWIARKIRKRAGLQ